MILYGSSDTERALTGLRDLSTLQWYIIPLLAIVFYIYAIEIKKARQSGNWDNIFCGLTLFGLDFFDESWNGWVAWFTQYQAFWTTPGPTAFRVTVGWNIEIIFMFLLAGVVFGNMISPDREKKVLGIQKQWLIAIIMALFCVFIECMLNLGGHLTWVYPWWNLSWTGIWLLFFVAYFPLFFSCILVLNCKTIQKRLKAVGIIYLAAILLNLIGFAVGMVY